MILLPAEILELINAAADRHSVRRELVQAVAWSESRGNPRAVSPAGAKGVMQIMDATAQALGVLDPFDAAQNVEAGTRFLAQLITRFGTERKALAAYNWGPSRVNQGRPWPSQVRGYVERVLALANASGALAAAEPGASFPDPFDPGPMPEGAPGPFADGAQPSAQPSRSSSQPAQQQRLGAGDLLLTDQDMADLRFALRFVRGAREGWGAVRDELRDFLDSADVRELVSDVHATLMDVRADFERTRAETATTDAGTRVRVEGEPTDPS